VTREQLFISLLQCHQASQQPLNIVRVFLKEHMVLVELLLCVISRPENLLDLLIAAGGKDEGGQAHWTLMTLGEFLTQRFKVLV
jgi:hypothetical protein